MQITKNSIQTKIVFFFILLLTILFIVLFLLVSNESSDYIENSARDQMRVGQHVFEQALNAKSKSLSEAVKILSQDFIFRKAISTQDKTTIISALNRYRSKIEADVALYIDKKDVLTANTKPVDAQKTLFAFSDLLSQAESQGKTSSIIPFQGQIYHVVIVPLKVSENTAWICMGFLINKTILDDLAKSSLLDVTFIYKQAYWQIVASTLNDLDYDHLIEYLASRDDSLSEHKIDLTELNNKRMLVSLTSLKELTDPRIRAVVHRPLDDVYTAMNKLRLQMATLFILTLVAALIWTFVIARGITRPLRALIGKIQRISQGEGFEYLKHEHGGEIGELIHEFNQMQKAIKSREELIEYRAYYDDLTGLPNRNFFLEELQRMLRKAKRNKGRVFVLTLNIDRFKDVNDTLGHFSGDDILKKLSKRLIDNFSEHCLIARLGGNEFGLLLSHEIDEMDLSSFIEKVLGLFNKPFALPGIKLEVAGRVGVAIYPKHADNAAHLMQKSVIAADIAKDKKQLHSLYEQSLDKHSIFRLSVMSELRTAVQKNELILFYQPKVSLKEQKTSQVEALVRWLHPKHGVISPTQFIPLAEQTGQVRYLTQWALNMAIKQIYEWQCSGMPLKIAINISTVDLMDAQLITQIESQLASVPIDPSRLILEITESAIMNTPERSIDLLHRINSLGVGLSIDDFGTGYSSMTQLKDLPVQEIKIDRSFVRGIANDPSDLLIVKSTVELGHNMNLQVVAEGVDEVKIFDILTQMGCDMAQGHYISPPLSITDLSQWLIRSKLGIHDPE